MQMVKDIERVNRLATKYYCAALEARPLIKAKVADRIGERILKKYHIGYAPKAGLKDYLEEQGIYRTTALESNLICQGASGYYDMFRQRIMIPIVHNRRIVGFGGRSLNDGDTAKYINSKASLLYDKKSTLYLLDAAKKTMAEKGWGVLVEGYFDVLTLYRHRIQNTVASCGTALTDDHALAIRRWADYMYICYDGDDAGREAAEKAKKVLRRNSVVGNVVELPKKHDPDSYVRKHGIKKFTQLFEG